MSASELGSLLADLGERLSSAEVEAALRCLDADGSGVVEFNEFVAWYKRSA